MGRHGLIVGAWVVHALGWLLPFHKDGVALPEGVPGWQAFRVAFSDVWPYAPFYSAVQSNTWYGALLSTLSALSSLAMLLSVWVVLRPSGRSLRVLSWLVVVAFVVDAQWVVLWGRDWMDLRAGYFLWWLSFLLLAIGARRIHGKTDEHRAQNVGRPDSMLGRLSKENDYTQ